jgi:hypothetical protein
MMRHFAAAVLAAGLLWVLTHSPAGPMFAGATVVVGLVVADIR